MKMTKRKLALAAADILTVAGIACLIWGIAIVTRWAIDQKDILLSTMEKMQNPLTGVAIVALATCSCGVVWRDCLLSNEDQAYKYPCEADVRAFATAIIIILAITGTLYAGLGSELFAQEKRANEYSVKNIICVYPDSGNATDAFVKYKTKVEGLTEELHARNLGYTNVVARDDITKPEDELEPEGKILVIPRSYLKEVE